MQYKSKKNLSKILFITILLSFTIFLAGCDWLSSGLLNVFDPQAQIRLSYTEVDLAEGTIDLEIYSLNEVEFIGTGFEYEYYVGTTKISSLTKMVGATFYVAASPGLGTAGAITEIIGLPLYFQEAQDYMTSNPLVTEMTCTITLIGTDGAGHSISKSVTVDLPALQPGIDFEPPTAVITVSPSTTGTAPFTVVFDASGSTDNRGIASYSWSFGDGTTGSGVLVSHTYVNSGAYIVVLTVTDYYGNKGYATEVITVGDAGDAGGPTANIQVTPGITGTVPFTVAFDASGSTVSSESDCSCSITSYGWDFGDTSTGSGIATTHTYTTAGTYIVILTVTDSNGKVGYATVVITVTSEEEPAIESITVSANPQSNVPGGTSTISALVIDTEGDVVADGTTVYFYTNSGTLSATSANTVNGITTVTLTLSTSMQDGDTATVTAFIGSVNGNIVITCEEESETESIALSANPQSNVPGGVSIITAIVRKEDGSFVDDGTTVYFTTNSGELSVASATIVNGVVAIELTLDDNMQAGETATVTAFTLNSSEEKTVNVVCIDVIVTIYADDYTDDEYLITSESVSITAIVTDTLGEPVENSIIVIFFTNVGTINPIYATTTGGIATTTLTLSDGDTATVTAKCGSRISNSIVITYEAP